MISRREAVKMINGYMNHNKGTICQDGQIKGPWHFGRVELKHLLDAIYGPVDPRNIDEHLLAK